ncbi:MAG: menD, partial [Ilumatobacteraceae bacterium]|nr:menD [Ilumatobacteraceae bacterium]
HRLTGPVGATCTVLAASVTTAAPADWFASWSAAERTAQATITAALDGALTEPAVARLLTTGALASGGHVVVASSMPIRDVEWFGGSGAGLTVHANRGANGIDGVVATAIGVAIGSGSPTAVLLGDVALCHDASSLTALAGRGLDLTIVVVDNDGGGIFSFLPQAERLPPARFEQLFGTPHGTDVVALAAAHGLPACTAGSPQELRAAVAAPGTKLVRVVSERTGNVDVHRRINDAVVAALAAH